MKIAVAQLTVSESKEENLGKARYFIAKAKQEGADLVLFSEGFMAIVPVTSSVSHAEVAEPLDGPFVQALAAQANKHNIYVVCGLYESKEGETVRAYNTIVFLDRQGCLISSYRKTHLYDAFLRRESDGIIPGNQPLLPVKTDIGVIGLLVCYELRFPEVSRTLALKGAEILLVPTAWVTGSMKEAHFLNLCQARALENTVFLCAADQIGNGYVGRSVVYNPMGVAMAGCGEDEGLIVVEIDLEKIKTTRDKLPCLSQRRPELYDL